jgi:hypothetical protein
LTSEDLLAMIEWIPGDIALESMRTVLLGEKKRLVQCGDTDGFDVRSAVRSSR